MELKKLRCNKSLGEWYYRKVSDEDLDAPVFELYDSNQEFVMTFGFYSDMVYYITTGIVV